eukprot:TRINITY_DN1634_c0_g1_i1.p1 TRINITY_DN1634_c0_g1~~TRINITY_DN1634_c0_g1_i1.p1  ORF type:complete len:318 (-),score=78.46 TRINITY_DN1634_c0_g1_i1:684-1637(-)
MLNVDAASSAAMERAFEPMVDHPDFGSGRTLHNHLIPKIREVVLQDVDIEDEDALPLDDARRLLVREEHLRTAVDAWLAEHKLRAAPEEAAARPAGRGLERSMHLSAHVPLAPAVASRTAATALVAGNVELRGGRRRGRSAAPGDWLSNAARRRINDALQVANLPDAPRYSEAAEDPTALARLVDIVWQHGNRANGLTREQVAGEVAEAVRDKVEHDAAVEAWQEEEAAAEDEEQEERERARWTADLNRDAKIIVTEMVDDVMEWVECDACGRKEPNPCRNGPNGTPFMPVTKRQTVQRRVTKTVLRDSPEAAGGAS